MLRTGHHWLTKVHTDYAGWTDKYSGQSFPADDGFYKIVRHEPIGVVAGLVGYKHEEDVLLTLSVSSLGTDRWLLSD